VIKYLAAERRIEIAFVPIAGTRVLVPFRMTILRRLDPRCWKRVVCDDRDAAAGGERIEPSAFPLAGRSRL
jgi:hypothetical protein